MDAEDAVSTCIVIADSYSRLGIKESISPAVCAVHVIQTWKHHLSLTCLHWFKSTSVTRRPSLTRHKPCRNSLKCSEKIDWERRVKSLSTRYFLNQSEVKPRSSAKEVFYWLTKQINDTNMLLFLKKKKKNRCIKRPTKNRGLWEFRERFLYLASFTCNCFEFWLVHCVVCACLVWVFQKTCIIQSDQTSLYSTNQQQKPIVTWLTVHWFPADGSSFMSPGRF